MEWWNAYKTVSKKIKCSVRWWKILFCSREGLSKLFLLEYEKIAKCINKRSQVLTEFVCYGNVSSAEVYEKPCILQFQCITHDNIIIIESLTVVIFPFLENLKILKKIQFRTVFNDTKFMIACDTRLRLVVILNLYETGSCTNKSNLILTYFASWKKFKKCYHLCWSRKLWRIAV